MQGYQVPGYVFALVLLMMAFTLAAILGVEGVGVAIGQLVASVAALIAVIYSLIRHKRRNR